ncbi:MAG: DUF1592 domain-containing protein [Gemmataceae bacterium]|nr:DUF1592 domain-containing protein [Gemmataceae bacterium]
MLRRSLLLLVLVPALRAAPAAFLEKHCVACHNAKTRRADVSLHGIKADADWARNRKLADAVLRVLKAGEMPPSAKPRPPVADADAFLASVQKALDETDRTAKPDPGRVVLRRLNRTEYDNTIRDLVGVDFKPAEDFPSDDIGHGFDNIGDVLTLPPVLMERYLAAAESIMERAILPVAPKVPERYLASRWLEPSQPNDIRHRPLDKRGHMLHMLQRLGIEGDYVFRFRACAKRPDKAPVRVAVLLGDKELKRFDIDAAEGKPQVYAVNVTLKPGDHRFYVKLLDPPGERTIHVEWFNVNGPADTRPPSHRKLLATTGKTDDEKSREVLERFASRAYRRPATKDELDRLLKLAEGARKRGDGWEQSMQLAMQAVLVSPKFLFRAEAGETPKTADPVPLDDWQLASRLSYFLWSSMPDDELFKLAGEKKLKANVEAQVRRMLKDPKASALTENFALQWLQLRRLAAHAPDAKLFPRFDDSLRKAMLKETELFFGEIVKEDRSVLDLIDGKYTWLNERLTHHYGIIDTNGSTWGRKAKTPGKPIKGNDFVRVALQPDDPRGGILTHGSVLTVTSNPTRTSPVKRGKWVLEQLLGTPPPPPPPDVPELDEKKVLTGSLRQQMEQHRKNPACAACHAKMDPLGFAFENFDAVGAYRWKEGKADIDASGELPGGKKFKGATELRPLLREKKDLVARNLAEKLLVYALGRGLEWYDRRAVDAIVAGMAKDEYRFSALAVGIAKSLPFTHRRGKE